MHYFNVYSWKVCFLLLNITFVRLQGSAVDVLFTFCCGTCHVSSLVGMTLHYIWIIPMITFELAAFYYY